VLRLYCVTPKLCYAYVVLRLHCVTLTLFYAYIVLRLGLHSVALVDRTLL